MAAAHKFTFELTPELREAMDAHPEVNWSAVFRRAVTQQVQAMELTDEILEEMNDPRVAALAAALKAGAAQRYRRAIRAHRG